MLYKGSLMVQIEDLWKRIRLLTENIYEQKIHEMDSQGVNKMTSVITDKQNKHGEVKLLSWMTKKKKGSMLLLI